MRHSFCEYQFHAIILWNFITFNQLSQSYWSVFWSFLTVYFWRNLIADIEKPEATRESQKNATIATLCFSTRIECPVQIALPCQDVVTRIRNPSFNIDLENWMHQEKHLSCAVWLYCLLIIEKTTRGGDSYLLHRTKSLLHVKFGTRTHWTFTMQRLPV